MRLGEILSSSLNKAGYYALVYPEYPSRIRGGDNNIQIVLSTFSKISPRKKVDILFAFSDALKSLHQDDVEKGGLIFSAQDLKFDEIEEIYNNPIVMNMTIAGFVWGLLSQNQNILLAQVKSLLGAKHFLLNEKVAKIGFSLSSPWKKFEIKPSPDKIFGATGNEVFALSAILAQCEYASIYPMTPITSLLDELSKSEIRLVEPEDEIFAAISAIGASYAGKRSMTATSGGGFCLMSEAVGLSAMAEIPLVIVLGQRAGPSSGIPTYSSQADLNFAIFSGHGDFPKIVLAPGDLEEVSRLTQTAFNLADQYQVPVIILTDKYLSETRFSASKSFKKIKINRGLRYTKAASDYRRYKLTKSGISPRAFPGETVFKTCSYEHDDFGLSTDSAKIKVEMMEKRMRKLEALSGGFEIYGNKKSPDLIIGFGSTKTVIMEFLDANPRLKYIHIWRPWPFPDDLKEEIKKAKNVISIENNFSGQLAYLVARETGISPKKFLKDDGRPFFKEELLEAISSKL